MREPTATILLPNSGIWNGTRRDGAGVERAKCPINQRLSGTAHYENGRAQANFECGAFNHSATSPRRQIGGWPPWSGGVLGEDGGPNKARNQQFRKRPPGKNQVPIRGKAKEQ